MKGRSGAILAPVQVVSFQKKHEQHMEQKRSIRNSWRFKTHLIKSDCIPPKIKIEPENDGLEGDFPFLSGSMLNFRGEIVVWCLNILQF